jgi:hypothetical protein
MKLLMCIDDTDNLDSPGTGEILENIGQGIANNGWGQVSYITRHQFLIHEDINYTSHNSSMCFLIETNFENCSGLTQEECRDKIIAFAMNYLLENGAEGSDPGLCVADLEKISQEEIGKLMEFGSRAKKEVLSKKAAYLVAEEIEGVHLSEHGGTGDGVIGAIAGCGLRLSGNDGRIKGKIKAENPGEIITAKELKKRCNAAAVRTVPDQIELDDACMILIGDEIKAVYSHYQMTLPVCVNEASETSPQAGWRTCTKKQLKGF